MREHVAARIAPLLRGRRGQALAEYTLILMLITVVAIAALVLLATPIGSDFAAAAGSF